MNCFQNILYKLQRVHIFVKSRKVRNTAQSTKMAYVYFLAIEKYNYRNLIYV